MTTVQQARAWLDRWDRQQEISIADREERFAVLADVVESAVGRPDPLVLDLGVGPGSLAVRLLDRLPSAEVIGVDADPLLLGLARLAYGNRTGLRLVECDLRAPDWTAALGLARPVDAVVSTTALHWLTREQLAAVYTSAGELLRPGGVLVNGDHLGEPTERGGVDRLAHVVRDARAARVGLAHHEDWAAWWEAAARSKDLAELTTGRVARPIDHATHEAATIEDHVRSLTAAGFAEVGTVWQHGDDRVLVALRG